MADILVAALSARSLAQSARSAGFAPLAVDFFRDLDLQEACDRSARVAGDPDEGFASGPLAAALDALAAGRDPVGMVCGTGFEDRPHLLERLAERWPLFGNCGDSVRRVKDPARLAELCERRGIPHPRWSAAARPGWHRKWVGGAGGSHIGEARASSDESAQPACARVYWQERAAGEPVSALVLASGDDALVLGFSEQWADPVPGAPFRYGGAVRPAGLSPSLRAALASAARSAVSAAGLVGLNSVDFLVAPDGWRLLEINPRPGATLDIFRPAVSSLFGLHVEACRGRLPAEAPAFGAACGAAIVYAGRRIAKTPEIEWPDWTADRQAPGTSIQAGAPVCTVLAQGETAAEAKQVLARRAAAIREAVGAG